VKIKKSQQKKKIQFQHHLAQVMATQVVHLQAAVASGLLCTIDIYNFNVDRHYRSVMATILRFCCIV
jgi:hypothetical protein